MKYKQINNKGMTLPELILAVLMLTYSIETKFQDTAQVDGLTVWKSNGEVPFADMLLDFVQIGGITLEQAEFSLLQRQKDASASLETLYRADDGNVYLGEGALAYRDERLAKIAEAA